MSKPDGIEKRWKAAEEHIEQGRLADARQILEALAVELPDESFFQWRLGYVLLDMHLADRALALFSQVIRCDPQCAPAWGGLGQAYMELGAWEKAEHAFRERIAIKPTPHHYSFLGMVLRAQNRIPEAIDCCKRAIDLDPRFAEPWFNMSVLYGLLHREEDAKNALRKAFELDASYTRRQVLAEGRRETRGQRRRHQRGC